MIKNSRTVLIDKNPGRNAQTFGIARELGTEVDLIHEPSVGIVIGNKGDSQCYIGVYNKVQAIQSSLKARIGTSENQLKFRPYNLNSQLQPQTVFAMAQKKCVTH